MNRNLAWLEAGLVLSLAAGLACAAEDRPGGTKDDPGMDLRPGLKRVDGRVKEIDLKVRKIAVEVETEAGKDRVLMIFLLTEETKVREREKARTVEDIHKGNPVFVFYRPPEKKDAIPTALFIRILEGGPAGRRPPRTN